MRFRFALVLILAGLLLSACNFTLAADITPPPGYVPPSPLPTLGPLHPAQAPSVESGQGIYAEKCQACHGETGLGDGPQGKQLPVPVAALGLADTAREASPARWFTVVSQGNIERYMPPFTSLSEQERWDVVAYALSLHTPADSLAKGKSLFEQKCAGCPTAPFTDQQKMAALSEDDLARLVRQGGDGLPAFGADLSDADAYAVAGYLRSLSFAGAPAATATAVPATQTPAAAQSGTPGAAPTAGEGTPASNATPQAGTPQAGLTPEGTAAAAAGTLTGSVAAQGGVSLPAGTAITLRGFDHPKDASTGPQEVLTRQGALGSGGAFSFEGVDLPEGRILVAEIEYQGVTYQSATHTVAAGENSVALDPIKVYPSTEDFKGLSLNQLHVAFDFGTGEKLQVFEIYSFSNNTEQAIIIKTDGSQVPFIAIPAGAEQVGFEAGQDSAPFTAAKDGIAIVPNEMPYSLIAFFDLPYNTKGTSVIQPLLLETKSISVFVPEGVKLKSDTLSDAGVQDISGTSFQMYSAKELSAGTNLSFTLSGKAKTPSETTQSPAASNRNTIIYGAGALGLALIAVGAWLYLRDRKGSAVEESEDTAEFDEAESVMDAIIALDDLHRAKKIPDEAYQLRRAELKQRLRELEGRE